jgi:(p)ppGpp synthase/HD superfamily hydrolase
MTATPQSARQIAGALRHRLVSSVDELRINERNVILKALTFAEEHYHQYRKKTRSFPDRGVLLITHPMRVALILIEELELKDTGAITSALLHELVEWKREQVSIADIERGFGRPIAMLVSILTKPPIDSDASAEEKVQKLNTYYRRIEKASVVSKLVKLADRLDSVREAPEWLELERQKQYLEETKTIYLPIAEETDAYLHEELLTAVEFLEAAINKPGVTDSSSSVPEIIKVVDHEEDPADQSNGDVAASTESGAKSTDSDADE